MLLLTDATNGCFPNVKVNSSFFILIGIVYCFSRKDSEDVASLLASYGIPSHCYHADMPAELKSHVHKAWSEGDIQVYRTGNNCHMSLWMRDFSKHLAKKIL